VDDEDGPGFDDGERRQRQRPAFFQSLRRTSRCFGGTDTFVLLAIEFRCSWWVTGEACGGRDAAVELRGMPPGAGQKNDKRLAIRSHDFGRSTGGPPAQTAATLGIIATNAVVRATNRLDDALEPRGFLSDITPDERPIVPPAEIADKPIRRRINARV